MYLALQISNKILNFTLVFLGLINSVSVISFQSVVSRKVQPFQKPLSRRFLSFIYFDNKPVQKLCARIAFLLSKLKPVSRLTSLFCYQFKIVSYANS